MLGAAYVDALADVGRRAGLDAVGVAPATPFASTRQHLQERRRAGLHGGMGFTYRDPLRSTDPGVALSGAAALVVGARQYPPPRAASAHDGPGARPHGRVAAYARRDHYSALRAALASVAHRLRRDGWRARVLVDDNALVDREAAYRAGLGWYGQNANLLVPRRGSWFVLGAVVTSAPLPASAAPVADGCGACRACLDGCPTGAIIAPGVVDARRCLAWLVQAPGSFPVEHRVALGDRIYGCDDCQEVCPQNRRVGGERERGRDGAGDGGDGGDGSRVDVLELLEADDVTLLARHGRWYIADRQASVLRRNALVVLGNTGDARQPAVRAVVRRYVEHPDPMLAEHARWAAGRLGL